MNVLRLVTDSDSAQLPPTPVTNPAPFEDLGQDAAAAGQRRARREGNDFDLIALEVLRECGATIVRERHRIGAVTVGARVRGANGREFWILSHGNADRAAAKSPGLRRTDTVRKAGDWAFLLGEMIDRLPVIIVTSHLPHPNSASAKQLDCHMSVIFDVIATEDDDPGHARLRSYLTGNPTMQPGPTPWNFAPAGQQLTLGLSKEQRDA